MIDKKYIIGGFVVFAILAGLYQKGYSDGKKAESSAQQEEIAKYKAEQAKLKIKHSEEIKEITAELDTVRAQAMKGFNDYTMREGNEKSRDCITVPIGGSVWLRK
jgi:hypothetical protein